VRPVDLLRPWHDVFGSEFVSAAEVLKRVSGRGASKHSELKRAVDALRTRYRKGPIRADHLGQWCRKRLLREYEGYRLVGKHNDVHVLWSVERVGTGPDIEVDVLADKILAPIAHSDQSVLQGLTGDWRQDLAVEEEPKPTRAKPSQSRRQKPAELTPRLPSWERNGGKRAPIIRGTPRPICASERRFMNAVEMQTSILPTPKKWDPFNV